MPSQVAGASILTVNGGSSSLKFALFDHVDDEPPKPLVRGKLSRVGLPKARATISHVDGSPDSSEEIACTDLPAAADWLVAWLHAHADESKIQIVAHRVVHGGPNYHEPQVIDHALLAELGRISTLDPDHLPGEIALVEHLEKRLQKSAHVACFDTAFHHNMPRVAQLVPIPRKYESLGIRRYGFHGLSYAYLLEHLTASVGEHAANGRLILAHLGAGASLAAVHEGRSIDTTMGLTPTSGIVMATRTGDIDPGLAYFLARSQGMTLDQFHAMVNHQSGLLGISETSPDFQELLALEASDPRAAEALDLFIYHAKKAIGSLAAALGGIDTLVFTGGIGENSAEARHRICTGLEFLGIVLDQDRNIAGLPMISKPDAPVDVRVIATDEESMMARSAARLLAKS